MHQVPMPLCQSAFSQLLVIDAQERLARAMPEAALAAMIANTNRLIEAAKVLEIPIIVTEQNPNGLGKTIGEIQSNLPAETHVTEKTCFSCCTAAGFERGLTSNARRKQVVMVGMEAHICILQTASGLQRWGYQVFVAEDAICSRKEAHLGNALTRMRHSSVHVSNTESIAFEWLGDSNNPRFREVWSLFR